MFVLKGVAEKKWFRIITIIIILVNSILIGVSLTYDFKIINITQTIILYYFVFEFVLRYLSSNSFKEFISDGWARFDLMLIIIGFIPENGSFDPSILLAFRTLRLLRVLRLLRSSHEVKVTVMVLMKSLKSLAATSFLLIVFIYLFALLGMQLFQGESLIAYAGNTLDPFGTVKESMFTLLRMMTTDDWTDIRYGLIFSSSCSAGIVDLFHISWIVLSTFLLLNLIVGAIVSNFRQVMEKETMKFHTSNEILTKIDKIKKDILSVENHIIHKK